MARVLINHGWTNRRSVGHWQRHLAAELRTAGHQVQYPQYPETEHPKFEPWQELLVAELDILHEAGTDEVVVICHSLGCVNLLSAAVNNLIEKPIDRLLLVAPADPRMLGELEGFQLDVAAARPAIEKVARSITLVASDRDPWLPRGVDVTYGEPFGLEPIILPGAGHIALADGFGPWRGVFDWVQDPKADLRVH